MTTETARARVTFDTATTTLTDELVARRLRRIPKEARIADFRLEGALIVYEFEWPIT